MHQAKLILFLLLVSFVYSSSSTFTLQSQPATNYKEVINKWIPPIMIAGLLAFSIIGIVYAIGKAFNIDKLKTYASSEIPQIIGTLFFSLLIISILEFGSSLLISFEDSILPKESLQAVCDNINLAYNKFNFVEPSDNASYGLDAIYGIAYKYKSNLTNLAICEVIKDPSGNEPYYFLASSEIILLNKTAQLINFSNSLYVLHTALSFLQKLENKLEVHPIATISFSPFAYFDPVASQIKDIAKDIIGYISFNFISIMLILFLYEYWVGLLMAGIFLRTFSFTRKLGGFLIAFVISTIFIMPFIYIVSYSTIAKIWPTKLSMNPNPSIQPICTKNSQSVTGGSGCYTCISGISHEDGCGGIQEPPPSSCPQSCPIVSCVDVTPPDTFVGLVSTCWECTSSNPPQTSEPPLDYQGFCGCFWYPYHGGILGWEFSKFFENFLGPVTVSAVTHSLSGYPCNLDTATAYAVFLGSSDFIGGIAVETYLPPVITFFVTIANILGLSWLFGGTTKIFGLEKLVG